MKESNLAEIAKILSDKAQELRTQELMKAHSGDIHSTVNSLHGILEDICWITGREGGRRCTKCSDGFYIADHCTECGHEEFQ